LFRRWETRFNAPLVKWHNTRFVILDWQFDSVKGHQIILGVAQSG
jgi:hypothetical protein